MDSWPYTIPHHHSTSWQLPGNGSLLDHWLLGCEGLILITEIHHIYHSLLGRWCSCSLGTECDLSSCPHNSCNLL